MCWKKLCWLFVSEQLSLPCVSTQPLCSLHRICKEETCAWTAFLTECHFTRAFSFVISMFSTIACSWVSCGLLSSRAFQEEWKYISVFLNKNPITFDVCRGLLVWYKTQNFLLGFESARTRSANTFSLSKGNLWQKKAVVWTGRNYLLWPWLHE